MQQDDYVHGHLPGNDDRHSRRLRFCAYLSASTILGTVLWGGVFSLPILAQGENPIVVVSEAVGYREQIDDPMILATESDISLIQPAAGTAEGERDSSTLPYSD